MSKVKFGPDDLAVFEAHSIIEMDEGYCQVAAERLAQDNLFGEAA